MERPLELIKFLENGNRVVNHWFMTCLQMQKRVEGVEVQAFLFNNSGAFCSCRKVKESYKLFSLQFVAKNALVVPSKLEISSNPLKVRYWPERKQKTRDKFFLSRTLHENSISSPGRKFQQQDNSQLFVLLGFGTLLKMIRN